MLLPSALMCQADVSAGKITDQEVGPGYRMIMNYDIEKLVYLIWLSTCSNPGSEDAFRLLDRLGGAREIFEADRADLCTVVRTDSAIITKIMRHDIEKARDILRACRELDIDIIPYDSEEYPKRLTGIRGRPILLYAKGHIDGLNERLCVGVVGTRNITNYGGNATVKICTELCNAGTVIVSGGALGIDSYANCTAYNMGCETVVVLGNGLASPYPPENADLFRGISKRGMVISEYPPEAPCSRYTFPERNRIISGMSDAVLVVEAGLKSGALITAGDAIRQERRLYAVPGFIDAKYSFGTNKLIHDGASICRCGADILEDFKESFSYLNESMVARDGEWFIVPRGRNGRVKPQSPENIQDVREKHGGTAHLVNETTAPEDREVPEHIKKKMESTPAGGAPRVVRATVPEPQLSGNEKIVYDRIPAGTQVLPDKLCGDNLGITEVMSILTTLEIYGCVEMLPGGFCRRTSGG